MEKGMFAYMIETPEGRQFTICDTADEAGKEARELHDMGYTVTVFDYDKTEDTFLEFYTLQ